MRHNLKYKYGNRVFCVDNIMSVYETNKSAVYNWCWKSIERRYDVGSVDNQRI